MKSTKATKLVHEGRYAAEVDIELTRDDDAWGPYLSVADANKLDEVRIALRRGDIKGAARLARVYALTPVAV
jgi:hypothetical protein